MTITKNDVKKKANQFVDQKDYKKAFEELWQLGVEDFTSYCLKKSECKKKSERKEEVKFLAHSEMGKVFWGDFILEEDHLRDIFSTAHDEGTSLLHIYFSNPSVHNVAFLTGLAKQFPDILVKGIRVNMAFLKDPYREELATMSLPNRLQPHIKLWEVLYEKEKECWGKVEAHLQSIQSDISFYDLLAVGVMWIEQKKYERTRLPQLPKASNKLSDDLTNLFSFFIEFNTP